jgi:uncharacterized protein (TIRG00374 family)
VKRVQLSAEAHGGVPCEVPAAGGKRRRRSRPALRTAATLALVAAIFGLALPHFASYRNVWVSVQTMSWPSALLIAVAAAASLVSYWIVIRAVLPSVSLRQAAVVNLGSSAVANTLPAGGALAMGISWAMLSGWGVSASDYVLYTLASGAWNVFARLGLPVLALLGLLTVSRPDDVLTGSAVAGLAVLAATATGLWFMLRNQAIALRAGRLAQRAAGLVCRLARRPPPGDVAGSVAGFRGKARSLVAARGWQITGATILSNLLLWLVLLACLRGLGLTQQAVSWQTSLAAFAFVRLLTVVPVTPGGVGIIELGLVGVLAHGAGHRVAAPVAAAVLLYRAVTYVLPIPLGAAACLLWRHVPAFAGTARHAGAQPEPPLSTEPELTPAAD